MPITQNSFVQTYNKLNELFNKYNKNGILPNQREIETCIYYFLLTSIRSEEESAKIYEQFYKKYMWTYADHFLTLRFKETAKIENDSYFYVSSNIPPDLYMEQRIIGLFRVNYKEYYTLKPHSRNGEGVMKDILKFLDMLPGLHDELYKLSRQNSDCINFKVQNHLFDLIKHPDSLVIYYNKKELSNVIRATVEHYFNKGGIKFVKRMTRADSGFDFHSIDTAKEISRSHSELIAHLIASELIKDFNPKMVLNKAKTIKYLQRAIKRLNEFNEQEINHLLYA